MSNNQNTGVWIFLIAKFFYFILAVLIVLILLLKDCADTTDPIDNSWKEIVHLRNIYVRDSIGNGFRVAYVTKRAVTDARAKQMLTRQPLRDSWDALEKEAPLHFGPMLYTDIYDFACFARQYDVDPDVEIHCIFVIGEKRLLYIGPNPKIPDSASYFDDNTEQGTLWINHADVYHCDRPDRRYRYWKCDIPYSFSKTDEHFSHFSEKNRMK